MTFKWNLVDSLKKMEGWKFLHRKEYFYGKGTRVFRYCVLFIHGGVYADYDVLCETDLDSAINPEVGFIVPVLIGRCLWNGLIGSAPGHPFMAAAIETVVNYVRNRYTIVDIMNSLCHDGYIEHYAEMHEALYLSGPCLLGNVVNQVLGRPPQTVFDFAAKKSYNMLLHALGVPGDLELLEYQQSHFLGGNRFILPSKNLVVAGTAFPRAKDAVEIRSPSSHYSRLAGLGKLFGTFETYVDMDGVNEDIRLVLAATSEEEEEVT